MKKKKGGDTKNLNNPKEGKKSRTDKPKIE